MLYYKHDSRSRCVSIIIRNKDIGDTDLAATRTTKTSKQKKDAMAVINSQIKSQEFANVYLLYGDERYLVNRYRDRLINALISKDDTLNFMKFAGKGMDTSELIGFCSELPFFAERRVALVENSGLFKSSNEELAKSLEKIEETSVIVFVEMEVDTRYKLFKAVDKLGEALKFTTPDEKLLVAWVRSMFREENIEIVDAAVYRIIEAANMDMNNIRNEADKLISYAADKKRVDIQDVDLLCNQSMESKVFQMADCIIAGQKEKACRLYHDLIDNKEAVIRINAGVMGQFNRLLIVKLSGGASDAEVAKNAGCPVWAVKNYRGHCRSYTLDELKKIVERCQDFDYRLKTGQAMDVSEMETMIAELSER